MKLKFKILKTSTLSNHFPLEFIDTHIQSPALEIDPRPCGTAVPPFPLSLSPSLARPSRNDGQNIVISLTSTSTFNLKYSNKKDT